MQWRWSRQIYTVSKRITPTIKQVGYPSMYELEEQPGVRWSREELQRVPEKRAIVPRQQQSGMGPVPQETLRRLKTLVREEVVIGASQLRPRCCLLTSRVTVESQRHRSGRRDLFDCHLNHERWR